MDGPGSSAREAEVHNAVFVATVVYFTLLPIKNIHNFFLFSSTKFSGLIDASCSQGLVKEGKKWEEARRETMELGFPFLWNLRWTVIEYTIPSGSPFVLPIIKGNQCVADTVNYLLILVLFFPGKKIRWF